LSLEKHALKTTQILDKGATTNITFRVGESDTYYCSVPGHRAAGMEGRLDVSDEPHVVSDGIAPSVDGRALNLDFENGTLANWTVPGDAFALVKAEYPGDGRAGSAGRFWVGSGANGAAAKGTMTSAPFPVQHPYASFLIGGGAFASTRVEIVLAEDN